MSAGASHRMNEFPSHGGSFAGEYECGVVEEIDRLSLWLGPGDVAHGPPPGREDAPRPRGEGIDLRYPGHLDDAGASPCPDVERAVPGRGVNRPYLRRTISVPER